MRENDQKGTIELSLPASRDMMLVVRLAASGVVARAGLTLDVLEDVKMAVEEACLFLVAQSGAERLRLTFDPKPGEFSVRIAREGGRTPAPELPEAELDVVRCILEALVTSVRIDAQAGGVEAISLKAASRA